MLERHRGLGPKQLFAVVQLPQVLPRLVPLGQGDEQQFILLEEAVSARLPELFGGFDVLSWTTFRITRDSDIELLEQESDDMLRLIEDRLKARQRGEAVRLEVAAGGNEELMRMIIERRIDARRRARPSRYSEVYRIPGPLDLTALMELMQAAEPRHAARRRRFRRSRRAGMRRARRRSVRADRPAATSCCTIRSTRSIRWSSSSTARPTIRTCWPSSRRSIAPAAIRPSRGP